MLSHYENTKGTPSHCAIVALVQPALLPLLHLSQAKMQHIDARSGPKKGRCFRLPQMIKHTWRMRIADLGLRDRASSVGSTIWGLANVRFQFVPHSRRYEHVDGGFLGRRHKG